MYWNLFFVLTQDLSWRIFHVHLRRICILLLLCSACYVCLLSLISFIVVFKSPIFFKDFTIYLLLGRGKEREKKRERNVNVLEIHRLVASPTSPAGWQTRHVPRMGIELVTFWFTGWHSIHWATAARAKSSIFIHFLSICPIHYLK